MWKLSTESKLLYKYVTKITNVISRPECFKLLSTKKLACLKLQTSKKTLQPIFPIFSLRTDSSKWQVVVLENEMRKRQATHGRAVDDHEGFSVHVKPFLTHKTRQFEDCSW
jgi:hypothetical protein